MDKFFRFNFLQLAYPPPKEQEEKEHAQTSNQMNKINEQKPAEK